jgi:hypothetical protein
MESSGKWSAMSELHTAGQFDFEPLAPVRCHGCGSSDIIPLPVATFSDRLCWAAYYGPFKCRKCRKKLYRRVRRTWFTGEVPR